LKGTVVGREEEGGFVCVGLVFTCFSIRPHLVLAASANNMELIRFMFPVPMDSMYLRVATLSEKRQL